MTLWNDKEPELERYKAQPEKENKPLLGCGAVIMFFILYFKYILGISVAVIIVCAYFSVQEINEKRKKVIDSRTPFKYHVNEVVHLKPDSTQGIVRRRDYLGASKRYYVRYMTQRGYKKIYVYESEIY